MNRWGEGGRASKKLLCRDDLFQRSPAFRVTAHRLSIPDNRIRLWLCCSGKRDRSKWGAQIPGWGEKQNHPKQSHTHFTGDFDCSGVLVTIFQRDRWGCWTPKAPAASAQVTLTAPGTRQTTRMAWKNSGEKARRHRAAQQTAEQGPPCSVRSRFFRGLRLQEDGSWPRLACLRFAADLVRAISHTAHLSARSCLPPRAHILNS